MLIDAHCHINSLTKNEFDTVLSCAAEGIVFIDVSIDRQSLLRSLEISRTYDFIYTSLGFHPFSGDTFDVHTIEEVRSFLSSSERIVAIGEVGLDYKADLPEDRQVDILSKFILLAQEYRLPVMIHNRWKTDLIFDVLDRYFSDYSRVIFHCFSQDKEFMEKVIEKNGTVSFSLNILRRKDIRDVLKYVGDGNFILETDSPYMKIEGKLSNPCDIRRVYELAAEVRNISLPGLCRIVAENVERLFGIRPM